MAPAVYDTTSAEIDGRPRRLPRLGLDAEVRRATSRPTGSPTRTRRTTDKDAPKLPPLTEGETLKLVEVAPEKKETQPPPRFNEASLVKFLEENGIGRPSTYVEILRKIEERALRPPQGPPVHPDRARAHGHRAPDPVLRRLLRDVLHGAHGGGARRGRGGQALLDEGARRSSTRPSRATATARSRTWCRARRASCSAEAKKLKLSVVPTIDEKCPHCGKKLKLRMGKNGLFVACSGYPGCTFTLNIPDPEEDVVDVSEIENTTCDECGSPMKLRQSRTGSTFLGCTAYPKCRNVVNVAVAGGKAEARPDEPTGEKCPRCGHELVRRHGRYGAYVSCSNYPACKYKPPKPIKDTGVRCPKDGGIIAERRGRFRPFYGCVNYPNCDFSLSVRPIPEACPQCGNPYLLLRERKSGNVFACDKAGCGFEKPAGRDAADRRDHSGGAARRPEPVVAAARQGEDQAKAPAGTKAAKAAKAAAPRRRAAAPRRRSSGKAVKAPWEKFSLPAGGAPCATGSSAEFVRTMREVFGPLVERVGTFPPGRTLG